MKIKTAIFCSIILLATIYAITIRGVIDHEQVHKQISIYAGCDNVKTNINYLTISGEEWCEDITHRISIEEKTLHSQNEIVSYNINRLVMVGWIICMFICGSILYIGKVGD